MILVVGKCIHYLFMSDVSFNASKNKVASIEKKERELKVQGSKKTPTFVINESQIKML